MSQSLGRRGLLRNDLHKGLKQLVSKFVYIMLVNGDRVDLLPNSGCFCGIDHSSTEGSPVSLFCLDLITHSFRSKTESIFGSAIFCYPQRF